MHHMYLIHAIAFSCQTLQIARFELKLALLASGRLVEAAALNVNQSELVGQVACAALTTQGC
jgi:hypothetical protein